ncbi:hypothetical protein QBC46DRAFT_341803 [Diplogelasinospora grovesii]|uniref:Alcohol dehydrogenase-like N-terminal domain-containing protein n=1 Tax=Diplogelasinospora grovesii TaxID=303347 RepID=A0AAN6N882_9PEZI|nr:hypothetical protein QBC46DRAFT_341803 [Diplogelasinospora grovesii]
MPPPLSDRATVPAFQKAVVQGREGKPTILGNVSVPKLSSGDLLIKTAMVALNPCDYYKMGAAFPSPGAGIRNDFVGTVVHIHQKTSTDIRIGDTVCGLVHRSDPADRSMAHPRSIFVRRPTWCFEFLRASSSRMLQLGARGSPPPVAGHMQAVILSLPPSKLEPRVEVEIKGV